MAGVRTYFHYADEGLIGEYDSTGNEIKTYGYKPGSTWTTDPLFMKVGANYYFYQNDHLGTPQKMTAVNGAVVWAATYSSFGEATVEIATIENNLRFPGQYWDAESGLCYNYMRYYDAETGKYMRVDPMGLIPDKTFIPENIYQEILKSYNHIYSYANNNPVNIFDQYGLCPAINHKVPIKYTDQADAKDNSGWIELKCDLVESEGDCKCPGDTKKCKYRCKRRYILVKNSGGNVIHSWEDLGIRYYTVSCND